MDAYIALEPGKYYHVYNRGIAGANIFVEERNYRHFLSLYALHVDPIAETFAYCLLRNHFHLLIRVRLQAKSTPGRDEEPAGAASNAANPSAIRCFSNFFNAYAKAINHAFKRTGSLFEHPFKRLEVRQESYCQQLVHYIHQNPQRHGFVADFRAYDYSSYRTLLSDKPTHLQRKIVLDWFGGRTSFDAIHASLGDEAGISGLVGCDRD